MAYKVSDVLNRAAKRLRILPGGDVLQAEDAADALDAYNAMMFGFKTDGLTLTDPADVEYTHVLQTASDDFPLGPEHFDSVWPVLMTKLIGQFPIDASVVQGVGPEIEAAWNKLYASFLVIEEADVSGAGPLPSQYDKWWGI